MSLLHALIPEQYLLSLSIYEFIENNLFFTIKKKSTDKNKSHLLTIENNNNSTQKNL